MVVPVPGAGAVLTRTTCSGCAGCGTPRRRRRRPPRRPRRDSGGAPRRRRRVRRPGPCRATSPTSRTYAVEARRSAMAAFCSTSMTEVPLALISCTVSAIRAAISGARPRDGSSSRSSRGPAIRARPIASICCSPPESSPARWCARSERTGNSSWTRARAALVRLRPPRAPRAPARRLSATVIRAKTCRPSGTWTTPAATTWAGRSPSRGRPSNRMVPVPVPRWKPRVRDTARSSVVLPAPLPPSTAVIAPSGTSTEMSRRARTGP